MKTKLDNLSKLETLIKYLPSVKARNISRLNNGDLSHIGDYIVANGPDCKIEHLNRGHVPSNELTFDAGSCWYSIPKRKITINGKEFNAGETVAPWIGTWYYIPLLAWQDDQFRWRTFHWLGDTVDNGYLENGMVFLNKDDAIAISKEFAKILLSQGE